MTWNSPYILHLQSPQRSIKAPGPGFLQQLVFHHKNAQNPVFLLEIPQTQVWMGHPIPTPLWSPDTRSPCYFWSIRTLLIWTLLQAMHVALVYFCGAVVAYFVRSVQFLSVTYISFVFITF